ncbi:MAG: Ribonuclease 3 [Tenericutes bacterium ADurb.BinA155]|nr:MAG: Ribonuclease 3 [Tenericutes bacterium ADurb.BinA155]
MSEFSPLYRQFKILPHDEELYVLAFTHSSYNGMAGTRHQDYERLEFLGDSVVGMVTSELCYLYHPEMEQGELSILKAQFIRTQSEASYAKKLGLDHFIRVGASFQGKVADTPNVLEDVFESFIGAVFLDRGLDFVYALVRAVFEDDIKNGSIHIEQNPKSALQEAMQADHKESVVYKIIEEAGPSHDKHFIAAVYFEDQELARGEGPNKKAAETAAASNALTKMAKAPKE